MHPYVLGFALKEKKQPRQAVGTWVQISRQPCILGTNSEMGLLLYFGTLK